MANLSFYLDDRYTDSDGLCSVKLRVVNGNTNASKSTGIRVSVSEWDKNAQRIKPRSQYSRDNNYYLQDILYRYNKKIRDLDEISIKNARATDILSWLVEQEAKKEEKISLPAKEEAISFFTRLNSYADNCRKEKTAESFYSTARKVKEYLKYSGKKSKDIALKDINYDFLTNMHNWMVRSGLKLNSCAIHETNIRTIWNATTRSRLIDKNLNPFEDFHIRHAKKKEIAYLPIEGMRKLINYDFSGIPGAEGLEKARDVFLLAFYLCGVNIGDLYTLPKPNKDGEIILVRHKIEWQEPQPVHIFIPNEAYKIINKYTDKSRLLNFHTHYCDYDSFYAAMRHKIDKIGKLIGYPNITLGLSRYTWSTYAGVCGASQFAVDKMLGHAPSSSLAGAVYMHFDWEEGKKLTQKVAKYATYES